MSNNNMNKPIVDLDHDMSESNGDTEHATNVADVGHTEQQPGILGDDPTTALVRQRRQRTWTVTEEQLRQAQDIFLAQNVRLGNYEATIENYESTMEHMRAEGKWAIDTLATVLTEGRQLMQDKTQLQEKVKAAEIAKSEMKDQCEQAKVNAERMNQNYIQQVNLKTEVEQSFKTFKTSAEQKMLETTETCATMIREKEAAYETLKATALKEVQDRDQRGSARDTEIQGLRVYSDSLEDEIKRLNRILSEERTAVQTEVSRLKHNESNLQTELNKHWEKDTTIRSLQQNVADKENELREEKQKNTGSGNGSSAGGSNNNNNNPPGGPTSHQPAFTGLSDATDLLQTLSDKKDTKLKSKFM